MDILILCINTHIFYLNINCVVYTVNLPIRQNLIVVDILYEYCHVLLKILFYSTVF